MFWSKTWFLLIALAGALAVAVALLAARPLQHDLERETGARLERAQHSASLLLKVNARKWIDTAAQVSTDAVLAEALEQATKGPADLGLVHKTVQERLRYFNEKMKVDLVWATDARGRVIARAGLDDQVYKDGIEGFPLVADALRGLRGDDAWSIGGKLYRVAASPVIARDHYAGALVVGQEVAGELAQSMKRVLDVDVAFLLRGRVLAASAQLPLLGQLPLLVDQHAEEMTQNGRSAPLMIDHAGESYLVVLAPFVGEAQDHKAAYALVVPRQPGVTLGYLTSQLLAMDPKTLPWMQLAPVGGGLLLALIIGFVLMRLEAIGPAKRLARESQSLARGDVTRLDDGRHPGRFGTVARAVNTTLDRLGSAPRMTASPPRGSDGPFSRPEPFGARDPRPEPAFVPRQEPAFVPRQEPAFAPRQEFSTSAPESFSPRREGFASPRQEPMVPPPRPSSPAFAPTVQEERAQTDAEPPSVPEFENSATVQRNRPSPPALPRDSMPSLMEPDDRPDTSELRATEIRNVSPMMTSGPGMPTMQGNAPGRGDTQPQEAGPDFVESPSELLTPLKHRIPTPRPMPSPVPMGVGNPGASVQKDPFDDQTAVASPSEALLRAARDSSQVAPAPVEDPLDTEFRQVYRDFIDTKQACGEPTEGITFDKFSGKLRSNRQQLITRYSCKTVKFQVYIKDGKAALKATPVTT
ncbi:MAG: hypothetical protein JWN44_6193 [Myxococcales bacterium]|nr:hypothetical protein [Myxococcales bacterium]